VHAGLLTRRPRGLPPGARPELVAHLAEPRSRLVISLIAVAATFGVAYAYHQRIVLWLDAALPAEHRRPVTLGIAEPFMMSLKISLAAGLVLALPSAGRPPRTTPPSAMPPPANSVLFRNAARFGACVASSASWIAPSASTVSRVKWSDMVPPSVDVVVRTGSIRSPARSGSKSICVGISNRIGSACESVVSTTKRSFMPGFIGLPELIVLGLVLLLIFGPKRLPEMGRSLGNGMREFKDSVTGDKQQPQQELVPDTLAVEPVQVGSKRVA
jgi:sec-independent protein translocase protein TatA